jgi:hypothetical protein
MSWFKLICISQSGGGGVGGTRDQRDRGNSSYQVFMAVRDGDRANPRQIYGVNHARITVPLRLCVPG